MSQEVAKKTAVEFDEFVPEIAKNAQVPPGFKIEKIFQVPRSMGSWVSLTTGPGGQPSVIQNPRMLRISAQFRF